MQYERAEQIADSLRSGSMFPCHKTTRAGGADCKKKRWCNGALGTMENEGIALENQMVRICGRINQCPDPADIDRSNLYDSLEEWVEQHD